MTKNSETAQVRRLDDREVLAAVPPTARAREFRVGIFVILGIAAFFTILFSMTSPAMFRGRYMMTTHVEDAQGIRRGDPVRMRGINIGRVHDFALDRGGVTVTIEIDGDWDVPVGSRAELESSGVLGGMVVSVVPGGGGGAMAAWDELPGTAVGGVFERAGDLAGGAQDVLARIQALLSDSTVAGTEAAVVALRDLLQGLTGVVDDQAAEVRSITASLARSAENVEGITEAEEWQRAIASAESAISTLDRTATTAETAASRLDVVLARMERGEGTIGQLFANDSLYHSLNAAASSLKDLLDDVKANPGRYINIKVF